MNILNDTESPEKSILSHSRWEVLLRYRTIEIIALWEGRLTTRHLIEMFGIGRQQASKDINNYKRSVAPDNLAYDTTLKGYYPTPQFAPKLTRGEVSEYLELVASHGELGQALSERAFSQPTTETLQVPQRHVRPEILRPILQAIREHRRLEVDYVSLNHPDREGRIIVPHTLVWTGHRWHVRAWCEKNQDFRDFVLTRFRGEPELMDPSPHTGDNDQDWHTFATVELSPDPRLTPEQQAIVALDYHMSNQQLSITVRAKLVPYLLHLLHLDHSPNGDDPLAQQIILSNREELSDWLIRQ